VYLVRPGQFADATLRAFVPRNGQIKISTTSKLSVTEYMCQTLPNIGSVCRNHNPVLSSFMTHHWFVTRVTLIFTEHTSSTPVFSGIRGVQSLVFCVVFCISVCPFLWPLYCLSFSDDIGVFSSCGNLP
jgi:hypothetical protein